MPTTLKDITMFYNDTVIMKVGTGTLNDNSSELEINELPTKWNLVEHKQSTYGHNNENVYTITGTREQLRGGVPFEAKMKIVAWKTSPPPNFKFRR